ncbi:carbohydrate ABC transporter permease [Elioraea sp.]|jgi:multiple sugar transport system permease protein|uniref:carbohydrate ABC transporter permease n=1 Tax=Elioraea sp. TaxID=2185103 RepID=UPI0021DBFBBD|nr:carbohydrate ABC transporter permease [Elioraea sp.]GIX11437.1 MAG: sn-glycerol-3-phosphate transport system permease protein UgpE [Elioraea sp.]
MSASRLIGRIAAHTVLAAGAVVMAAPFAWMLLTSIRPPEEVFGAVFDPIPSRFAGVENYGQALTASNLPRAMLNGVIVCGGILAVQLLTAIPAAYALARLSFRGRGLLFALVLFGLTIPIQVPALPLYIAFANLRLLDTYFALMAPFFLTVFGLFLFRQFFRTYPEEILQAARLDGMGEFEIVWRIAAPAALPAIAAFSVFSVVAHWNDLYWPLIVVTSSERATPALGILAFRDAETGGNYGALMAAASLITGPMIAGFLLARRAFVRGITMTGVR